MKLLVRLHSGSNVRTLLRVLCKRLGTTEAPPFFAEDKLLHVDRTRYSIVQVFDVVLCLTEDTRSCLSSSRPEHTLEAHHRHTLLSEAEHVRNKTTSRCVL